jgi:hypothetical protein
VNWYRGDAVLTFECLYCDDAFAELWPAVNGKVLVPLWLWDDSGADWAVVAFYHWAGGEMPEEFVKNVKWPGIRRRSRPRL